LSAVFVSEDGASCGGGALQLMETVAESATGDSWSAFINAVFTAERVTAEGQLPPAVTQYFSSPHWLTSMLGMVHDIVLVPGM